MNDKTVTIIDDDVNRRIIIETLLEVRGFAVGALDPDDAARAATQLPLTAVVIVAADQAEMRALRTVQALHGNESLSAERPRTLVLFDSASLADMRGARRAGADAVLHAAVEPGRLLATVDRLARGAPPWDPLLGLGDVFPDNLPSA